MVALGRACYVSIPDFGHGFTLGILHRIMIAGSIKKNYDSYDNDDVVWTAYSGVGESIVSVDIHLAIVCHATTPISAAMYGP